ncbi:MAG: methyltransferase domain-containing protein [Candidatus Pacearchaeota archaeon]
MKLNLGCGNDYREGYVNCDWTDKVKVDKIVNLEKKLPFKDNSVDEIICFHVLEHVNNFIPLMHELYRISKKDAKIIIKTPFYSAWGQFNDPTHVRFFTPWTFDYFKKGNYSHEVGADKDMFEIKEVKINFGIGESSKLNKIINPIVNLNHKIYCRFFAWIFPCAEIRYQLKIIK